MPQSQPERQTHPEQVAAGQRQLYRIQTQAERGWHFASPDEKIHPVVEWEPPCQTQRAAELEAGQQRLQRRIGTVHHRRPEQGPVLAEHRRQT